MVVTISVDLLVTLMNTGLFTSKIVSGGDVDSDFNHLSGFANDFDEYMLTKH